MSLVLESLTLSSKNKKIIKNVSFTLNEKQSLGIFGPSASGKSTIAKAILGLNHTLKSQGRVSFASDLLAENGKNLVSLRERRFSYIPQNLALWPHLSVRQSISYSLKFSAWAKSKAEELLWFETLLNLVELEKHTELKPHMLSGGERQRLMLAVALAAKPRLLILDEALNALDQVAKTAIIRVIRKLYQELGFSFIVISHELKDIQKLCQSCLVLYEGEIFWQGNIAKLDHSSFPPEWNPFIL
jgi:ABC-type multidrug transport system ATPase subunit